MLAMGGRRRELPRQADRFRSLSHGLSLHPKRLLSAAIPGVSC